MAIERRKACRLVVSSPLSSLLSQLGLPAHGCSLQPKHSKVREEMSGEKGVDESAVAKFWRSPKLVEKFLAFPDGGSILRLATCHDLTKEISQKPSVWDKVVRRTCPDCPKGRPMDERALVASNKKKLVPLLELLKMAKDPSKMKLTLLEVICQRFPHTAERVRNMPGYDCPQFVKVRLLPPDTKHSVSALGFLLLEEVESRCRSAPNLVIDSFDFAQLEVQMLTALSRRVSSQKEPIKQVRVWDKGFGGGTIWCNTTQQAKALLTIVKKSEDANFEVDLFVGNVKKQGWAALGKVAELHGDGGFWRTFNLVSKRDDMLGADRGDLRKIWDGMHGGEFGNSWTVTREERFNYFVEDEQFHKSCGNREWLRLLQVLDLSEKEWDEYRGEDGSEYSESEEEEDGGDSSFDFEVEVNLENNQG